MRMNERRQKFVKGLSSLYLPYYHALCDQLSSHWQPYSGFRSFAEQDLLFAQGRSRSGRILTNANGGQSPHNYGCATDWTIWVEKDDQEVPLWPNPTDSVWEEYAQACEKVGLTWGGAFSIIDCPHNEIPLTCSWRHVLVEHNKGGMRMAQEHIERNLLK